MKPTRDRRSSRPPFVSKREQRRHERLMAKHVRRNRVWARLRAERQAQVAS